jgi:hypothetical protein
MELVTRKDESERLERNLPVPVPAYDIVLDDGSLVPDVAVVGDRAVGVIVGGHTGFLSFADVPQIVSRQIRNTLRLTQVHKLPFIGPCLRRRWARKVGASLDHPAWIPKL